MSETAVSAEGEDEATSALLSLEQMLERFDVEAYQHVFDGPRYNIRYATMGAGPPLLIVPGICSSIMLYSTLMVQLAQRFQVTVFDYPGVNSDDGADLAAYSLKNYVEDLLALGDHLGHATFRLLGISFGTTVCVRAMARAPDRITAAVLASGFVHRPLKARERFVRFFAGRSRGNLGKSLLMKLMVTRFHGKSLLARDPGLVDFLTQRRGLIPIRTAAAQSRAVDATNLSPILGSVSQPVLVVSGQEDPLVPPEQADELVEGLPNTQRLTIADCGHLPHLSHPELLAEAAMRFFMDATPQAT
ncbi:Putative non-heme bromoperoxidase BpoC [Planctomycetes bacterium Pan216]|uniref:Non-heme bromoperoxidase BpoC n=1 Tax=Kolteria novifilia TaxID=2527975 RepID=A0A518B0N7_9BACT|nr:Putative non-heme bromoperoxidase BpoC [Planctomycetes bacterium Pan216]